MRILILLLIFCLLSSAWSDIQFEEVSHQAGITRIGESWGNAWGDFDGDGYLDLWATNHKHKPSLYRNNGDGTFTDIIDEVWNANPHADTHGVAWADFDNDGDQDLIVLSGSGGGRTSVTNPTQDNHLYVNENGMLVERASELGVDFPLLRGRTPLWFDWNADGQLDVLLTGILRTDGDGKLVTPSLFQQTPSGFQDVSTASGLLIQNGASIAQLVDITDDGAMDLVLHGNPYPRKIYDISTIFLKTLIIPRFPIRYNVKDAVYADFNGDLVLDSFLGRGVFKSYIDTLDPQRVKIGIFANAQEKGVSFKAKGDVHFEIHSVWATWISHVLIGAKGHQLTEFDGEFIGTDPIRNAASFKFVLSPDDLRAAGLKNRPKFENQRIYVGYDPGAKRWTVLFHTMPRTKTTGDITMSAIIKASQPISDVTPINFAPNELNYRPQSILLINQINELKPTNDTFASGVVSVAAGDFDNDMDIDLYLVRSSSVGNLPNFVYENRGDGTFLQHVDARNANGSMQGKGQSVAMADYDNDGYLDLFVTNGRGGYPFNEGPDQLFRNIGRGNNWLQVDLEGTVSNRDGIGARLFATTPDGKTQLRENGGGIHWCQQDQKRIHFGLAQHTKVKELLIYWPSGIVQKLKNVPVNQVLHVVEPEGQTFLSADVNKDGRVDLLDLVFVAKHVGKNPPTNTRADVNRDGHVNIDDMILIIKAIEAKLTTAAPSNNTLSEADFGTLFALYEKIEDLPADSIQIEVVKRFLQQLLTPIERPLKTQLHANYPNPLNPETWIPYQLAEDTEITIRIYNASGQVVRTIFTGNQAAGYYLNRSKAAYWDGKNEFGEQVASGVYVYELTTPTFKQIKRLVVLK